MLKIDFIQADGVRECRECSIRDGRFLLPRTGIPAGTTSVEVRSEAFCAVAGDKGYLVIPNAFTGEKDCSIHHAALIRFRERPDMTESFRINPMPIFGIARNGTGMLGVVTGSRFDYALVVECRNGVYEMYPRFSLGEDGAAEDIELRFFPLQSDEADYSGMARRYRKFQLEHGCVPLRERSLRYPVLAEAAEGPLVRLRLAWKPVPPPVLEQTGENEPPVHAAMTFERAGELIDEFHRQGIEHAEFQLVGWNRGGHDGRFPDLYPVEPLLGGEEKMKELIEKARSCGYLISCHTNVLDSYTIAKRWRREDMLKDRDGEPVKGGCWGGGQSYFSCPKAAHEAYAVQDLREMREFGFRGTHYFDVMSILPPDRCYDKRHPLNRAEAGAWRGRTMALAREEVGASGSEGPFDFMASEMDYVLYVIFFDKPLPPLCDEKIPLWFLVYHGILGYNATCETANSALSPEGGAFLEQVEFGGRPLAYFYSKFLSTGYNWMGKGSDCTADGDGDMRDCVAKIKAEYDRYREVRDLQFAFIEKHETPAPGVARVAYSNGTVLTVNRSDREFDGVPPNSYRRVDA